MRDQQTIEKLHALKLTGMAEAFTEQLKQPDLARLSFEERQAQAQCLRRGFDYRAPRGIDQSVMMRLIGSDRRSDHRRRHPRPVGSQCAQDKSEGGIAEEKIRKLDLR